jgi:hypothetical protein
VGDVHYTVYECTITLVSTTHVPSMYNSQWYQIHFHQFNINHSTWINRNIFIIKN